MLKLFCDGAGCDVSVEVPSHPPGMMDVRARIMCGPGVLLPDGWKALSWSKDSEMSQVKARRQQMNMRMRMGMDMGVADIKAIMYFRANLCSACAVKIELKKVEGIVGYSSDGSQDELLS